MGKVLAPLADLYRNWVAASEREHEPGADASMSARSSLREVVVRRIREMPPARQLRFQLAIEALERFA